MESRAEQRRREESEEEMGEEERNWEERRGDGSGTLICHFRGKHGLPPVTPAPRTTQP